MLEQVIRLNSQPVNAGVSSYNGATGIAAATSLVSTGTGTVAFDLMFNNQGGATGTTPVAEVSLHSATKSAGNSSLGAAIANTAGATGILVPAAQSQVLHIEYRGVPEFSVLQVAGLTGPVYVAALTSFQRDF